MENKVRSNFWLCNMVLPQMTERRDGSIIVVSSIGGLRARPLLGVYGISKAADMQLVRNLAAEYGPPNVRGSEEHTFELKSQMRISYAVFCLKKKNRY